MGIFSFLKNIGKKVGSGREAEEIKQDIVGSLGGSVERLAVAFDDGTVTLTGTVDSPAAREKAVLLAGHVEGVEKVVEHLTVRVVVEVVEEPVFYTVQRGDSLSKIARKQYGDAMRWPVLFEANREVIKDPNLIYPGQQIRIPRLEEMNA